MIKWNVAAAQLRFKWFLVTNRYALNINKFHFRFCSRAQSTRNELRYLKSPFTRIAIQLTASTDQSEMHFSLSLSFY